jgi:anhydro-N-acetylmuramic acid kinase
MRVIGIMSGTSLDGIDVIDVDLARDGGKLAHRVRNFVTVPFGAAMREALEECLPPNGGSSVAIAELNFALSEAFGDAVLGALRAWRVEARSIDLIGSHGLTLYHAPDDGITMQIGEPAVISCRTGVTCVSDFRVADVARGGQGAPLVPFVDRELFAHDREHRAALNIGGIANVTLLPPSADAHQVIAFDTGPGNMLLDRAVAAISGGERRYDVDGEMAAAGTVDHPTLEDLLHHPYFALDPPKSTGRETFGPHFLNETMQRMQSRGLSDGDILATLTALTASTIAAAIPRECARVIASGGGVHNRTLMTMLRRALSEASKAAVVEESGAYGVEADQKEALAFAVLAFEALHGRPNHLACCTGAREQAVLGKVTPGTDFARLMKAVWGER